MQQRPTPMIGGHGAKSLTTQEVRRALERSSQWWETGRRWQGRRCQVWPGAHVAKIGSLGAQALLDQHGGEHMRKIGQNGYYKVMKRHGVTTAQHRRRAGMRCSAAPGIECPLDSSRFPGQFYTSIPQALPQIRIIHNLMRPRHATVDEVLTGDTSDIA